jgi:hypothetical protein
MFHYVYLDKKKNLIDIRLDTSITPFNFHQLMENLGLLNILLITAWELGIIYIKVGDIIGQIQFNFSYNNYNIYYYYQKLKSSDNYLELIEGNIRLKYQTIDINFTSGFLNWKQKEFPMYKAKVRPDIITSNGTILKPKLHDDILTALSCNSNSFMVLASDSSQYPNCYKLLIPDTKSDNELKYINIIENRKPVILIKPKCFQTRSYSLFIYSKEGNNYIPSHQIYLSGSNNQTLNMKSADTEFESILYNCLPTPKYSKKELQKMNQYYKENDDKYLDLKSKAIAIDPPGSRDKDDAINFNIVSSSSNKPLFLEMFVHISDVPPALNNNFNCYHFFYAFHKLETDYLYGTRYPMIDSNLSESTNSLSLIGPEKRAFTIKTTYKFKPDGKTIFNIPETVEMYLEKNIKIFATTYESIAVGTTDYSIDLPVNNQYVVKDKLMYEGKYLPTLNPVPCQAKQVNIDSMYWDCCSLSNEDKPYVQNQLNQIIEVYRILITSLDICQEIKSFIQTKQYYNDDYQFNLREEWVHRLIEITALESNKYASLILYDKIKNKSFGVNEKTKLIGKLNINQIKSYNSYFNRKERFNGSFDEDEGIFRGLYFGVKGHNDSPKYVKQKYNHCIPACIQSDIHKLKNINDLNNLYLKFQLDKLKGKNTPLSKLSSLASFNQTTENLGIALYSTTARPHFNTRLCYYTYFTSPMRRVVDCFVQNCLISSQSDVKEYIGMFKRHILNRTDINSQCEKYNLFISVCNKIFNGDKFNAEFETHYIKYGTETFNNLYLPNIDITISVNNKINSQLQPEGKIKLIFKQITEPFDLQVIPSNKSITVNDIIEEQNKLYFQNEKPPELNTHNYLYLNYRLLD